MQIVSHLVGFHAHRNVSTSIDRKHKIIQVKYL